MTANDNGYEYKELDREKIWVICEDCELLRSFDGKAVKAEFTATPAPSPLRLIAQKLIGCPKSKEDFGPQCRMSYYWTFEERTEKRRKRKQLVCECSIYALGKSLSLGVDPASM